LRHVLANTGAPVLYSDIDIYYYAPPQALEPELRQGRVLLFPQWNDRLWYSKFYGVFNAGMLGVQSGAEPFLEWWTERCLRDYNGDFLTGYFADQGFLDLAPAYFDDLHIYRHGDHNVAYWNTGTLVASYQPSEKREVHLQSGRPLRSFHAAVPDRLGIYEEKFGWDQIHTFASPLREPANLELIQQAITLQQSEHWLDLGRLRKAEQIFGLRPLSRNPRLTSFLLYTPAKWLLHFAARTHYHAVRCVREIRGYLRWFRPRSVAAEETRPNRSHFRLEPHPLSDAR
jgi:hypothetical protein